MKKTILAGVLAAALPMAAGAEVKSAAADGFLIEHRFTIAAPAAKVWESLQHPERWWPADHTWSGKRENLSLDASIGGCFCERWEGNAVEHGRVVLVMPEKMLRLDAALGPLQELAISGVITVALEEKDGTTAMRGHPPGQRRRLSQARRVRADRRPGKRAAVRRSRGGCREEIGS